MRSFEFYEKKDTIDLKRLLTYYEYLLDENEKSLSKVDIESFNYKKLEEENHDYQIDISLVRMELNRRFWAEFI